MHPNQDACVAKAAATTDDAQIAEAIRALVNSGGDEEDWHGAADDILVGLLNRLGYTLTTTAFDDLPKWYA